VREYIERMRALVRLAVVLALAASVPAATHVAAAASTPRCTTSGLVVWLNTQGDGAAGSTYYKLQLTNLSGNACTVQGFPGVSAVGLADGQVGRPAARNHTGTTRQVRLPNNGTAVAILRIVNVQNFPRSSCRPVVAAALRVYPPNQTGSKLVPFPFPACSRSAGPVFLFVRAVQRA
jgi:uncharacterized protein DUF4232